MATGNSIGVQRRSSKTQNKNKSGIRRALMIHHTRDRKLKRLKKHYVLNPKDRSAQSAIQRMANAN